MKKVRKAIIPAAGLGTRFLPATKALPKEMLPIVNKPTIQYIVEEAVNAGMEEIIIVTGKGKRAIEDHFDNAYELEQNLEHKGKLDLLERVRESSKIDIHYIRQKAPMGLGHAVWCARKFIGNEPFAVLLGDDIVQNEKPCIQQLAEQYEKTGCSAIAVQQVPYDQTQRYGIIDPESQNGRLYNVKQFVEKPKDNPPSNLAIIGRYVLTPEIFEFLDKQELGAGGEIQLTDAIQKVNELQGVYAYEFEGKRYDVGETLGFVLTNIEMALKNKDLQQDVLAGIHQILQTMKLPLA
ncbi:UTP--glucose-1-phosphate uridylyltransferase GalU [Sporolactobacillus inulinus]|uniref:UTP--glucose-1-phosphate uridylyltransferase n=1 Tax=Sporolactobacillus inulinus CASD TaxID=1069536 RepID=A0A0U1QL85_9BACL|nr:UTP--glucose-1-phosphate uridylyltransferase GalU [Sporolactobacillus inulinus]KLI01386.1 UTP--glucose-1-phosphate uridylyltransferase [Sporolactobacillus inulinus CASD]GEB77852.1 UTP--glucose-1-phosphate uridylyltransferase [Sporolactobacillus inulinus]